MRSRASGQRPQNKPVAIDSAAAKIQTRPSIAIVVERGSCVPASATNVRTIHPAASMPSAPPVNDRMMLSRVI